MKDVVIMRVVDCSDFDKVLHSVACANFKVAWEYADAALNVAKAKVDKEWHSALELRYETLSLVDVNDV